MPKILVDAGHGGSDVGAVGPTGLRESTVNLAVALKLGSLLQGLGQQISYTRTADTFPSINDRVNQANREGVHYFISVHCNSDGPSAVGIETLIFATGSASANLAKPVQAELLKATGDRDRGVKVRTDLGVLRGTKMPAILVEIGFISHKATEDKLRLDSYREDIAMAICQGTAAFLGLATTPKPPTPQPQPDPTTMVELVCPHCGKTIRLEASK